MSRATQEAPRSIGAWKHWECSVLLSCEVGGMRNKSNTLDDFPSISIMVNPKSYSFSWERRRLVSPSITHSSKSWRPPRPRPSPSDNPQEPLRWVFWDFEMRCSSPGYPPPGPILVTNPECKLDKGGGTPGWHIAPGDVIFGHRATGLMPTWTSAWLLIAAAGWLSTEMDRVSKMITVRTATNR